MEIRAMRFDFYQGETMTNQRPVVVAVLGTGERVSEAIRAAAEAYVERHGAGDVYAWVAVIPAGAEEYVEVTFAGGTAMLLQADWAPRGWVVVGRGGDAVIPPRLADTPQPYCVMAAL